jgi:hypothetical protein
LATRSFVGRSRAAVLTLAAFGEEEQGRSGNGCDPIAVLTPPSRLKRHMCPGRAIALGLG